MTNNENFLKNWQYRLSIIDYGIYDTLVSNTQKYSTEGSIKQIL